jgi:hypothetical protein
MTCETAKVYLEAMPQDNKSYDTATGLMSSLDRGNVLKCAQQAEERKQKLVEVLNNIHKQDESTKIVVFAEEGDAWMAARDALSNQEHGLRPRAHVRPEQGTDPAITQFGHVDVP